MTHTFFFLIFTFYATALSTQKEIFCLKNSTPKNNYYTIAYHIEKPEYIIEDSIVLNKDSQNKEDIKIDSINKGSIILKKNNKTYPILFDNGMIIISDQHITDTIHLTADILNSHSGEIKTKEISFSVFQKLTKTHSEKDQNDDISSSRTKESPLLEKKENVASLKKSPTTIEKLLHTVHAKNYLLMTLIIFCLGFLMSLTPCIYPMIPITISILGIDQQNFKSRLYSGFLYMCGMSTIFSLLGILAASGKIVFGGFWEHPLFVIGATIVLSIMTLNMMGLINFNFYWNSTLPMPTILQNSRYLPFFYGMFSGTISSPCVSPGLVAVLSLVSQQNNIFLAWLWLFLFGCGLSLPLFLIALIMNPGFIFPQSGSWMNELKEIIGIMLCFIIGNNIRLFGGYYLSSIIVAIIILYFIAYKIHTKNNTKGWYKNASLLLAFFSLFFIVYNTYNYYIKTQYNESLHIIWENSIESAKKKAIQQKKLVFVDITADWCSICKIVEKELFLNKDFMSIMNDICVFCKIDCTKKNEYNTNIIKQYHIKGYPALLLIDPRSDNLQKEYNGDILEMNREELLITMQTIHKEAYYE